MVGEACQFGIVDQSSVHCEWYALTYFPYSHSPIAHRYIAGESCRVARMFLM